ncbi:MAG: hypothetical protein HQK87_07740 [Nitrospinae bacterium]|nr:hypothetical protein [Nitrospinota bacterium]
MRSILAVLLTLCFPAGALAGEVDVRSFAIDGFRLGMTLDEARELNPWIKTVAVTPDPGMIVGYRATINDVTILFTGDALGKKAFFIERVKNYADLPDPVALLAELAETYGPPSQTGRDMTTTHSCWGRCYGDSPRLLYQLKMFGMLRGPFPASLLLRDPAVESANKQAYRQRRDGAHR